jgi:hypothetical protein
VRHDDFFETVRPSSQNPETLSHWQSLAGFKEIKNVIPASEGDSSRDADLNAVIPRTETLVHNVPQGDLQFDQQNKDQLELEAEIQEKCCGAKRKKCRAIATTNNYGTDGTHHAYENQSNKETRKTHRGWIFILLRSFTQR